MRPTWRGRIIKLMEGMDIPEGRKEDFAWLNRNLGIRNSQHPNYEHVRQLLKEWMVTGS